jgi:hypothetical protein
MGLILKYWLKEWRPELVNEVIKALNPFNMRVFYASKMYLSLSSKALLIP